MRFTRDVDLAVDVSGDKDAEILIHALRSGGYRPVATVAHEPLKRLATVRLMSPQGVLVDLLLASCGIEAEVIARGEVMNLGDIAELPVATAEDLLSLKILAMTKVRLQDRIDALNLLAFTPDLDLSIVRKNLGLMTERGFHRGQDLNAKLDAILEESEAAR